MLNLKKKSCEMMIPCITRSGIRERATKALEKHLFFQSLRFQSHNLTCARRFILGELHIEPSIISLDRMFQCPRKVAKKIVEIGLNPQQLPGQHAPIENKSRMAIAGENQLTASKCHISARDSILRHCDTKFGFLDASDWNQSVHLKES
jgi:hypothetical protein